MILCYIISEASDEVGDLEIVTVPERIVTVTATTNVSSSSDSHSDSMHSNRSERFTGFPKVTATSFNYS